MVCDIEDAGAIDRALESLAAAGCPAPPRPQAVEAYEVSRVAGRCIETLEALLRERRCR